MRVSFASLPVVMFIFMASTAMTALTTLTVHAFTLPCASSRLGDVSLSLSFYDYDNNAMDPYVFIHDEDGDDIVDDDDDDDVLFKTLGEDLPATFRNFQPSYEKMWELPAESWASNAGGAPMAPPEGMFMEVPPQFAHFKSPKQQQQHSQTEQPMLGGISMPQSLPASASMHQQQHQQQQQQTNPTPQQQQDKSFLPDATIPKIRGLEEPRFGWD